MAYGLTINQINMLKNVFEKEEAVEKVFIYGSRARNKFKKVSDIDLSVVLKNKNKRPALSRLKLELEEIPIIYEIDLIDDKNIVAGNFKDEYEKTKKLFYLRSKNNAN